jgi:hypothetical protein
MRAGLVLPMNQYAIDTSIIERLTDVKGALDEKEGVFKVSVPREELSVLLRLARVKTSFSPATLSAVGTVAEAQKKTILIMLAVKPR